MKKSTGKYTREATEHNKRTGMSTLNIGAGVRFHF